MEIWKDIEGYEGTYQISSLGNVKSLNYRGTKQEKLITKYYSLFIMNTNKQPCNSNLESLQIKSQN